MDKSCAITDQPDLKHLCDLCIWWIL